MGWILAIILVCHHAAVGIGYAGTFPACEHFFGVFIHYNEWSWNSLPKVYLDSSYLSTDKDAISTYFTGMEGASSHDDTTSDANGDFPDLQPTQYSDDLTDEPPKKKVN